MYMYTKGIDAQQKFYGFKNLVKLESVSMKIKIPKGRMIFRNLNTKVTITFCNLAPTFEVFHNFCMG